MKIFFLLGLFIILTFGKLLGQTIVTLDFPSCEYLQYHLSLKQGSKLDTIAVGRFDSIGGAIFSIPKEQKDFRGVGVLSVTGTSRSINLILNGEEKIVLTEEPNQIDVFISQSDENNSLKNLMSELSGIMGKYTSLISGDYNNTSLIFELPEVRKTTIEKEYASFWHSLEKNPLYAAKMLKLMSLLSGYGGSLTQSQDETIDEFQKYIVEELDIKDLYNSGFWNLALDRWCQVSSTNDTLLLKQSHQMLNRVDDIVLRRELLQAMVNQFSKYGKDTLLMDLGEEYLTIPVAGKPAPLLLFDNSAIKPFHSLIFFHDSSCGNCYNELYRLIEKYPLLSNEHNQMRVISISADMNSEEFQYTSNKLPWIDKYCDLRGFDGDNFKNYGIVGTPTFIFVDKEGIIRGRYASLSEFLK